MSLYISPNTPLVPDAERLQKALRTFFLYDDHKKVLLNRRLNPIAPVHIIAGTVPRVYVPTVGMMPYARALWLYHSVECPLRITYADGNSQNVSLANLNAPDGKVKQSKRRSNSDPELSRAYMRKYFMYSEHGYLLDVETAEKMDYVYRGKKLVRMPRGRTMTAARAIWLYHHDSLPDGRIQFKDGNPLNTKISNLMVGGKTLQERMDLRAATHSSLWGKHVTWYARTQKWRVRINGKHIGYFQDEREAQDAASDYINALKTAPLL